MSEEIGDYRLKLAVVLVVELKDTTLDALIERLNLEQEDVELQPETKSGRTFVYVFQRKFESENMTLTGIHEKVEELFGGCLNQCIPRAAQLKEIADEGAVVQAGVSILSSMLFNNFYLSPDHIALLNEWGASFSILSRSSTKAPKVDNGNVDVQLPKD
ncbi:MAG: hypothetical protein AAF492_27050 [Verrucomicrobiota bacterium]